MVNISLHACPAHAFVPAPHLRRLVVVIVDGNHQPLHARTAQSEPQLTQLQGEEGGVRGTGDGTHTGTQYKKQGLGGKG